MMRWWHDDDGGDDDDGDGGGGFKAARLVAGSQIPWIVGCARAI